MDKHTRHIQLTKLRNSPSQWPAASLSLYVLFGFSLVVLDVVPLVPVPLAVVPSGRLSLAALDAAVMIDSSLGVTIMVAEVLPEAVVAVYAPYKGPVLLLSDMAIYLGRAPC